MVIFNNMDILKFLQSDKNTRKVFGKRELKIIEKQLYGINLTQSEKNRLSRDIRKKFEFIKNISRYSDEFELKKASIIKEIINESKKIILEDFDSKNIEEIILYGSFIENSLSFKSDIDIAIKFEKVNLREATLFKKRILGKLNSKVDLQIYNILPKKIQKEINNNGRILYKNENK